MMTQCIPNDLQDTAAHEMASKHARSIPDTEYMNADKKFTALIAHILANRDTYTPLAMKEKLLALGLKELTADAVVLRILS